MFLNFFLACCSQTSDGMTATAVFECDTLEKKDSAHLSNVPLFAHSSFCFRSFSSCILSHFCRFLWHFIAFDCVCAHFALLSSQSLFLFFAYSVFYVLSHFLLFPVLFLFSIFCLLAFASFGVFHSSFIDSFSFFRRNSIPSRL